MTGGSAFATLLIKYQNKNNINQDYESLLKFQTVKISKNIQDTINCHTITLTHRHLPCCTLRVLLLADSTPIK